MMRSLVVLLGVTAVLFAGLACGGDDGGDPTPTSSDPSQAIPKNEIGKINIALAGADLYVGRNNLTFGILNAANEPQGGATAKATLYDLADPKNPKPVGSFDAVQSAPGVGPETKHIHADGETHVHGGQNENRVAYYVDYTFSHAGSWGLLVQATLRDGTKGTADIGFRVFDEAKYPQPGEKAIASDNLTRFDVTKISEIDSGSPANDMHDVKIKDALAKGRPLVVVFATPAYCASLFCGPVTEEVEYLHDQYADKVDFVHIEIWRDFGKKEFNPTVREWLIQPDGSASEPWVYVIGSDGVIYDRFEGPAARNIMEPAVKAVANGETFATRK